MQYPTHDEQTQAIIQIAYYKGSIPRKCMNAIETLIKRLDYYELMLSEASELIGALRKGDGDEQDA